MLALLSAFGPSDGSIPIEGTIPSTSDALIPPFHAIGCGAARLGELMAPQEKCANAGRCNAAPSSSTRVRQERIPVEPKQYERCNAPILWPRMLDEDTGMVDVYWAKAMRENQIKFWSNLGSSLMWRWTTFRIE
jgi:hypothetical protein